MTINSSNENDKNDSIKTINGFLLKKKQYDKMCYLRHISAKESKFFAELLASRGIEQKMLDDFLNPKLKNFLPKISKLRDIDVCAERIVKAINNGEKICIYGDYDVDGSTSTSLMLLWLRQMGSNADYYIPDRITEGYGANCDAIKKIAENGSSLIIFVDCGATATEPLKLANEMGVDVLVIDHHKTDEILPVCVAQVNPNRYDETDINAELHSLCACGVVFLVLLECSKILKNNNVIPPDLIGFVPLVAFATVCDVMSLTPLNRAFIKTGISVLQNNVSKKRPASKSFNLPILMDIATKKTNKRYEFNTYMFGFVVGPMINAGGRIGKSNLGTRLLISENSNDAKILAEELYDLNFERKNIELQALEEVFKQQEYIKKCINDNGFIILYSKNWHEGVIGLVASRVKDKYYYPTMIGTETDNGNIKFSCRSVSGIDIGKLILQANDAEFLVNGGGHELAGGFTCKKERIEDFISLARDSIKDLSNSLYNNRFIEYDTVLSLSGLSLELLNNVSKLEPFGIGNPKPIFLLQDVTVKWVDVIKAKHIQLVIADEESEERVICFNAFDSRIGNYIINSKGKNINLVVSATTGEFNGKKTRDIKIEDILENKK